MRFEDVSEWFELDREGPYMLLVADVVKNRRRTMTADEQALFGIDKRNVPRSEIPAVTHVDYSARVQTVHAETEPLQMRNRLAAPAAQGLDGATQRVAPARCQHEEDERERRRNRNRALR